MQYFPGRFLEAVGGFAAVLEYLTGTVLVVSTDGVGTKLRTAFISGFHKKVGIDLAAMVLNDILVYGALNGFFLNYISQGVQMPQRTNDIIEGMIAGCHMGRYGLVGGEMAELPGFYRDDEYDLAGFGVGLLPSRDDLIMGETIVPGMNAYGLASTGLHSNGFSLFWKAFGIDFSDPERAREQLDVHYPELGRTLLEEASIPTKIYQRDISLLMAKYEVAGMANVTGGGLVKNPQRILPSGCSVVVRLGSWSVPPVFPLIQKQGNVSDEEMRRVFNNGIGFIIYSAQEINEDWVYKIGEVVPGDGEVIFV